MMTIIDQANRFMDVAFSLFGSVAWFLFWIGMIRNEMGTLIAVDQFLAVVLLPDSYPDETISAWTHRKQHRRLEWLINFIFRNPNHCAEAYISEMNGSQTASDYSSKSSG